MISKNKKMIKLLNILSGAASCVAGVFMIIKGSPEIGISLITAGISKVIAHEAQAEKTKENTKLIHELSIYQQNGVHK